MRVNYQVSIDCADPHVLARFWADALGWQVEDVSGQVKALLDRGVATEADTVTVEGRLAWREASAVRDPDAAVDGHGLPERGRLLFQIVPEGKPDEPRTGRQPVGVCW